jgi:hypothetical protein
VNLLDQFSSIPNLTRFDKLIRSFRPLLSVLALCVAATILILPSQRAEAHEVGVCAGKNWCERRTDTCGPTGGYGKCLIARWGVNVCAEILFQAARCSDCAEPSCVNCVCAHATGGGDKCNNGANGYPYICVRRVAP